jgi:integrase/recombinase XerD
MKQALVLNEREKQRTLQLSQRSSYAARNRCMLQLSWLAGMRVGEIAALDIEDVLDPNAQVRAEIQLRADQTKGDKARTVFLDRPVRREISRIEKWSRWRQRQMTLNNSTLITPFSPALIAGKRFQHGSNLDEKT